LVTSHHKIHRGRPHPGTYHLARKYAIKLRDLADERFVMFSRALGPALYDEVIDACHEVGFEPQIGQITSIANLVAGELGVSIVPARMADAAGTGVSYLPIKGKAPVARIALATRVDDRSVITKNFRAFVQQKGRRQ